MREKPILFSTPMVQAIQREIDPKTQTRRVITRLFRLLKHGGPRLGGRPVGEAGNPENQLGFMTDCGIERPIYLPGDILWVRETFLPFPLKNKYYYKADNNHLELEQLGIKFKWRPCIHMPRAAARIFLRVTDTRVEQVQDISPEDCHAEGIINDLCADCLAMGDCCPQRAADDFCMGLEPLIDQYAALWEDLNGKRGYGWDRNPWVWVYTFERARDPREAAKPAGAYADQNTLQYAT